MKLYYGNYRGKVIAHGDKGRCKIYIPSIYPKTIGAISKDDESNYAKVLPWAEPALNIYGGNITGQGQCAWPDIGANVWVFFEGGMTTQPVYFASIQGGNAWLCGDNPIADGSTKQDGTSKTNNNGKYVSATKKTKMVIDDGECPETYYVQVDGNSSEVVFGDKIIKGKENIHLEVGGVLAEKKETTSLTISVDGIQMTNGKSTIVMAGDTISIDTSNLNITGQGNVGAGATGAFTTSTGQLVTVVNGIVTTV